MADTDPTSRILRLLGLLQRRPVWTGPELAERLGVTTRTVRRDVDRLRGLGYPVDAVAGHDGGYRLGSGGAMPPLLLDDEEATAVALALQSAAAGAAIGLAEPALAALAKIDQVLPPAARSRVEEVRAATVVLAPTGEDVDPDILVTAARGCAGSERLRLTYRSRSGRRTERRIEPYRMVSTGRRWHLVARDVEATLGDPPPDDDGWRTFRPDRIVALAPTGHRFVRTDPPDAAALVAAGTTVAPYDIVVRVRLDTSEAVARSRVPPTVGVVTVAGGATILTTGADDLAPIIGFLAQLDLPFEVLEPPDVRAAVRRLGARLERAHR